MYQDTYVVNDDGILSRRPKGIIINLDYFFSCRAALKTMEIVLLITAMSCMVQYALFWKSGPPATLVFYYMVVCLSWIFQLIFFIMMICSLEHRIPLYHWDLCGVFSSTVEVVVLLTVSTIMAIGAARHRRLEWKGDDLSDNVRYYYHNLLAALVLTLMAAILFIMDIILHAIKFSKARTRRRRIKQQLRFSPRSTTTTV